jgi:hypothetical protein
MGISEPGETERLLKRVSGLLAKVIKARDSYGLMREKAFQQANNLLAGALPVIRKEIEATEDPEKLQKVITLAIRVQGFVKEALKR